MRTNDVCVPAHCANKVLDEDEELVDCGGNDCAACPTYQALPGALDYCSLAQPCVAGFGDCDNTAQCMPGTVCTLNVGASFGYPPYVDVCMSSM